MNALPDLFNVVVFGGKEVIKPDALQEMDTDVSSVIQMKDYKETLTRTRDVIKKAGVWSGVRCDGD